MEKAGQQDIVIAGAGVAGLATALGLHRKGIRSVVLESSPTLRASGFALTIWSNAWRALDALGVGDKLRERHFLCQGFRFTGGDGSSPTSTQNLIVPGKHGLHEIRCVERQILLETLAGELPAGTITFSNKIVAIEEDSDSKLLLHLSDSTTIKAKVLIGCDGVNSVVSKWLGLKTPSFSGRSSSRGMAEYEEDHCFGAEFIQMAAQGFRAGFLPCSRKKVYWFFTWVPSAKDADPETRETMREFILSKLNKAGAAEMLIGAVERSEMGNAVSAPLKFRSPLSLLWGSISKGSVCVAGDALHPMTPDLGQGGCSALEDSVVLVRCLSHALLNGGNTGVPEQQRIKEGLHNYAESRRWRSIQLIATAVTLGAVMQSDNALVSMLRGLFVSSKVMANILLKMADYDCGKL